MRTPILVGLIFTSSLAVRAADKVQPLDVKLGLWEVTATVTTSGQMPVPADLLARLTPEQRASVEDRLKAQSSGSTKTTTRRHCVTREDLDKGTSFGEDRKSCTRTVVSSSKSQLEMRVECEDQGMKSIGRFQVEAIDSENVKGSIHLTASSGDPIAAQFVVDTPGGAVNINNITVDGNNNQINGCAPELIGIYYRNASGTVNQVAAINQTLSTALNGCQSGLGIFVQSGLSLNSTVTVENSYIANYQKNGITGDETGTTVTISSNRVFGQGPTTGAAENGIQFGFGAGGSAVSNTVMDNVYSPGTAAATGILVYASANVSVTSNIVGNSQLGISFDSDPTFGAADNGTIDSNKVSATHLFDGIDVCSNSNSVLKNSVFGSDESGIHLDGSCGSTGNSNTVTGNVINVSCAGILEDPSTTNTVSLNQYHNVTDTIATGPTCTTPPRGRRSEKPKPARP